LKVANDSYGLGKSIDGFLMFGLAHGVIGGLLGSQGGTVFDSLGKESNISNGLSELVLSISEKALSVDDSLLTLSLGGGVGISAIGGTGDFSITGNDILVMLSISS